MGLLIENTLLGEPIEDVVGDITDGIETCEAFLTVGEVIKVKLANV